MINDMRQLALIKLNSELSRVHLKMDSLREQYAKELAQYLVEDTGKVKRVYVLSPVLEKENTVRLSPLEIDSEKGKRLPFVKPSGSRSPAIGPIIKRTIKKQGHPPYGPTPNTLNLNRKEFIKLAQNQSPWQTYFQEITAILESKTLIFEGKDITIPEGSDVLTKAIELIDEKETVFLTIAVCQNGQEYWPGDKPEYHDYLAHELANIKYVTDDTPLQENGTCPLCGQQNITLYPNAVKGAGINISNANRAGAFCGLNTKYAWKSYALCLNCADLLYVFKNHMLPDFVSKVAGDKALILPSLMGDIDQDEFMDDWAKYLHQIDKHKALKPSIERDIMEFFKIQDDTHLLIHIIWATFGQNMENVTNYVTDILPSRLYQLSELNAQAKKWSFILFPRFRMDEAEFDLHLNMLWFLLKRPGYNKKVDKSNKSKQFREFRQRLANKIYHGSPLDSYDQQHLWYELIMIAQGYLADALKQNNIYGLTHEGYSEKKQEKYWTLAGWIRHIARFLYYLERTGVLVMNQDSQCTFQPEMPELKSFFNHESGINSNAKAFAFLVGILYGKLLQVQSAKDVNITASTIPWLKRLQLSGKDLPELYAKICHKFLTYDNTSSEIRQVIKAAAQVGTLVGDNIDLDTAKTGYFLLLGQALAVEVLPAKSQ